MRDVGEAPRKLLFGHPHTDFFGGVAGWEEAVRGHFNCGIGINHKNNTYSNIKQPDNSKDTKDSIRTEDICLYLYDSEENCFPRCLLYHLLQSSSQDDAKTAHFQ